MEAAEEINDLSEAREVLQLGEDLNANIISKIPDSAYYNKRCISPKCNRSFESTIRGLYCNHGPGGREGSSCRVFVKRLKESAEKYLDDISYFFVLVAVFSLTVFYLFRNGNGN